MCLAPNYISFSHLFHTRCLFVFSLSLCVYSLFVFYGSQFHPLILSILCFSSAAYTQILIMYHHRIQWRVLYIDYASTPHMPAPPPFSISATRVCYEQLREMRGKFSASDENFDIVSGLACVVPTQTK